MKNQVDSPINYAVIASGLGFFIDAYDLFLFNVYRVRSLTELGLNEQSIRTIGEQLLTYQMLGMMIGGILSGIIGDKYGRIKVLYGSIFIYSIANIANAYVTSTSSYALIRFFAGLGLAGELGAGITLVSETMSQQKRTLGTILVAALGAAGAVTAGITSDFMYWRTAFLLAGIAGLFLLVFRIKTQEAGIFTNQQTLVHKKGNFMLFFNDKIRLKKYLSFITIGAPIWYAVGLVITFTPELAKENHLGLVPLTKFFILFQIGITIGDLLSGWISYKVKSRKKILIAFLFIAFCSSIAHLVLLSLGVVQYISAFIMGLGCGYLSIFVTSIAENFGINLRVLATSTVTNFMRGSITILIPLNHIIESNITHSLTLSLLILAFLLFIPAIYLMKNIDETYHNDLNFIDQ